MEEVGTRHVCSWVDLGMDCLRDVRIWSREAELMNGCVVLGDGRMIRWLKGWGGAVRRWGKINSDGVDGDAVNGIIGGEIGGGNCSIIGRG